MNLTVKILVHLSLSYTHMHIFTHKCFYTPRHAICQQQFRCRCKFPSLLAWPSLCLCVFYTRIFCKTVNKNTHSFYFLEADKCCISVIISWNLILRNLMYEIYNLLSKTCGMFLITLCPNQTWCDKVSGIISSIWNDCSDQVVSHWEVLPTVKSHSFKILLQTAIYI